MKLKKLVVCILVGILTLSFSGVNTFAAEKNHKNYTSADLRLLSAIVHCEAQSESYNGKLAVAIVIMNRKRSNRYPSTLKGVIYQRWQFSPVSNGTLRRTLSEYDRGRFNSSSERESIKAAKAALNGVRSIKVNGKPKNFNKYLSFSGRLPGYTLRLGNHRFK